MATANSGTIESGPAISDEQLYRERRLRWPAAFVLLYWVGFGAVGLQELPMFTGFLARGSLLLLLILLVSIWWLARGTMRLSWRLLVSGWTAVVGTVITLLMHRTVLAVSVFFLALPALLTVWTIWLILARASTARTRLIGMLLIPVLLFALGTLVRMEGLKGDGSADFHWRWKRSAEDEFVKNQPPHRPPAADARSTIELPAVTADDWTEFRGSERDGTVRGVKFDANWQLNPPRLVWRTRVGPAWSSVVILGNRLYTQEQRGELKPDFSDLVHYDGHIYGFDGSIFCCVNLATGKREWKGGRYGAGQVLLVADQPVLLVITENGELVLVEPHPQKHHELARFKAIEGKTWNHPVISRGKLYVRNAEEMACFELGTAARVAKK